MVQLESNVRCEMRIQRMNLECQNSKTIVYVENLIATHW